MTNSHDAEIATVASKLVATIDKQAKIMQQLTSIGKKIEDHLYSPESEKVDGLLRILAGGANTATIVSKTPINEIRSLSFTLYSLLDDKKKEAKNG